MMAMRPRQEGPKGERASRAEGIQELIGRRLAQRRLGRQPFPAEESLQELRRLRRISQATVARQVFTTQPEVSRLERRSDARLTTLRTYVKALDGSLDLVARFPGLSVRITLRRR